MRPVVVSNIFTAGLSELDRPLLYWRIFLSHYIGGFLPPYQFPDFCSHIYKDDKYTYLNNIKLYY
jgi:hypothetical protein